jgi:hypothetical protein
MNLACTKKWKVDVVVADFPTLKSQPDQGIQVFVCFNFNPQLSLSSSSTVTQLKERRWREENELRRKYFSNAIFQVTSQKQSTCRELTNQQLFLQ